MSLERAFLSNADFVIEGYVDPREPLRGEGPARCAGNPKLEIRNPNR